MPSDTIKLCHSLPCLIAVILALRDIRPAEEVTISYVDEEAGLAERHTELADYGFVCSCAKCAAEARQ